MYIRLKASPLHSIRSGKNAGDFVGFVCHSENRKDGATSVYEHAGGEAVLPLMRPAHREERLQHRIRDELRVEQAPRGDAAMAPILHMTRTLHMPVTWTGRAGAAFVQKPRTGEDKEIVDLGKLLG